MNLNIELEEKKRFKMQKRPTMSVGELILSLERMERREIWVKIKTILKNQW